MTRPHPPGVAKAMQHLRQALWAGVGHLPTDVWEELEAAFWALSEADDPTPSRRFCRRDWALVWMLGFTAGVLLGYLAAR